MPGTRTTVTVAIRVTITASLLYWLVAAPGSLIFMGALGSVNSWLLALAVAIQACDLFGRRATQLIAAEIYVRQYSA